MSPQPTTYLAQKFISARLLFLVENTGVRRFHVHPSPSTSQIASQACPETASQTLADPVPSLLLWVFSPDLLFSSSIGEEGRSDPTRAIKVFYEKKTWRPLSAGEVEESSVEDVEFPLELFEELERGLRENQKVLPESARRFQGWDVGLLERFDVGEIEAGREGAGGDQAGS